MSDLKGKKLLLMGGSSAIPLAIRAKELGVHVIVTDYLVNSPVKKFADESYLVSTTDVEAVTVLARKLKVDGVFTAFTDWMLPYCRQICDNLNLPFYASAEQIDILTNKDKFKNKCTEHGLQVVKQYDFDVQGNRKKNHNIKYPVIVKPVDSEGGKGIYVCYTEKELKERYHDSLSFSRRKKVLVEEYMTGEQVSIFFTIQDGYVSLSAMSDRYTNKDQRGVASIPTALIFPSKYLSSFKNIEHPKVINLCNSLKIKNGVLFIQAFMHQGRVCIHEAGFRLIGAMVHKIIKEINKIDIVEMMIRHSLTGEMKGYPIKELDRPEFDQWACKLSPVARKGRIAKMKGFDRIATLKEVFDITHYHVEGDTITQIGTLDQMISRIFIKAETKNKFASVIEKVNTTIQVEDDKGANMLLDPFNPYSF